MNWVNPVVGQSCFVNGPESVDALRTVPGYRFQALVDFQVSAVTLDLFHQAGLNSNVVVTIPLQFIADSLGGNKSGGLLLDMQGMKVVLTTDMTGSEQSGRFPVIVKQTLIQPGCEPMDFN